MRTRPAVVAAGAALALLLPLGVAWLAAWTPVAPGERNRAADVLLLTLVEAPVILVLGAWGGLLLVQRSVVLARRPGTAGLAAVLGLVGMLAGVYCHVVVRGWLAGSPDVPPVSWMFRVDDFARAAPLVPVTMLIAALAGAIAATRAGTSGVWAGVAVGFLAGLAAGLAALPVSLLARLVGGAAVYLGLALSVLLVVLVAIRARRA